MIKFLASKRDGWRLAVPTNTTHYIDPYDTHMDKKKNPNNWF